MMYNGEAMSTKLMAKERALSEFGPAALDEELGMIFYTNDSVGLTVILVKTKDDEEPWLVYLNRLDLSIKKNKKTEYYFETREKAMNFLKNRGYLSLSCSSFIC